MNELKGEGTAANPYQITCATDFIRINDEPTACYQIMNDIDFGGAAYTSLKQPFSGKLDGGNHQINNLFLNGGGLFAEVVDTAVIKNLKIVSPVMALSHTATHAGMIANTMRGGFADGESNETGSVSGLRATLSNVHITSPTIVGNNFAGCCGGIIGEASLFVDVSVCSMTNADFTLPSAEFAGGLVGQMITSSNVQVATFTGSIEGGRTVGGIAASVDGDSPVFNAHVDAQMSALSVLGGVVGANERATIANCYVEGELSITSASDMSGVGAVVGMLSADILGGETAAVVHDNIVAISSIVAPQDVAAHRVVGFSSCNAYEYDWDKVDYSKPQSDWPRIYYGAEKCLKDNYVVSDLLVQDATISAEDYTTEGANLSEDQLTAEWLAAHAFALGESVDAPWMLTGTDLALWFETSISSGVDNVVDQPSISLENGILKANGKIQVYDLKGIMVAQGIDNIPVSQMNVGVYIIAISSEEGDSVHKLLIP